MSNTGKKTGKSAGTVAIVIVAAIVLFFIFRGCSSPPSTLEGTTWDITEATMNGQRYDADDFKADNGGVTPTLTFHNGIITSNAMGTGSTTYTYADGKLTIEGQTYDVSGNTIHISVGSNSLTLKKR